MELLQPEPKKGKYNGFQISDGLESAWASLLRILLQNMEETTSLTILGRCQKPESSFYIDFR